MNEIHFSECTYVSVNGFVYNVKSYIWTLINSSNHLLDIGSINFKEITNFHLHTQQQ